MRNFSIEFLTSKPTEKSPESRNQKIVMNNSLDSSWESSSSTSSPESSPSSVNKRFNSDAYMVNGIPGMSAYLTQNFAHIQQNAEVLGSIPLNAGAIHYGSSNETTRQQEVANMAGKAISRSKQNSSEISMVKEPSKTKPSHSYIALISMAILESSEKKLLLGDIYEYIMEKFPYFNNQEKAWRNSIRHNLSLNECFIKNGRSDNGKGNFWSIHPACLEDFSKGDFRRRQARRRARRTLPQMPARNPDIVYGTMGYVPMASSTLPLNSAAPQLGAYKPQVPMMSSSLPQMTNQIPQVSMTSRNLPSPTNESPKVTMTSGHLFSPTSLLPQISLTPGNQLPQVSMTSGHLLSPTNPGAAYFSYPNNMNCFINQTSLVPNQFQSW